METDTVLPGQVWTRNNEELTLDDGTVRQIREIFIVSEVASKGIIGEFQSQYRDMPHGEWVKRGGRRQTTTVERLNRLYRLDGSAWPNPKPPAAEQQRETESAADTMRNAATRLRRAVLAINDAAAECGLVEHDIDEAYMYLANVRPGLFRAASSVVGPKSMLKLADLMDGHADEATEIGPDHRALAVARSILGGK